MNNLRRVLESTCWTVRGPHERCFLEAFEEEWARRCMTRHTLGVSSGSSAVEIALRALGVGAGDEVVVPALGWYATAAAVLRAGAAPVYADVDVSTSCVRPEAVRATISDRTAAIIVVHLHGSVADLDALCELAREHRLPLIEDAAQAHGAYYKGRHVGSLGDVGCFSFNQEKLLCGGEGGGVITNNSELYLRLHALRTDGYLPPKPGQAPSEPHGGVAGNNLCLSELHAAHLLAQLNGYNEQQEVRAAHADALARRLSGIPGVTPLQSSAGTTRRAYYEFGILLDPELAAAGSRDFIASALSAELGFSVHATDGPPWQSPNMVFQQEPPVPQGARELHERLLVFHHRILLSADVVEAVPRALSKVLDAVRAEGAGAAASAASSAVRPAASPGGAGGEGYASYDALLRGWTEARADEFFSGLKGRWSLAGELDSPIPPERVAEVRARPPLAVDEVLDRHCGEGGLVVVNETRREGLAESLVVRRTRKYQEDKSFLPVWIRCWDFDLSENPSDLLSHYFKRVTGEGREHAGKTRKLIVLERPELARYKSGQITGLQARDALCAWKSAFARDQIVAVVGQESFIARDPYPGFYCVSFDDALPGDEPGAGSESLGFFPPAAVPRELLDTFFGEMERRPAGEQAGALFQTYRLLSTHLKGWPLDKNFFTPEQLDRLRPRRDLFASWLKLFVDQQLGTDGFARDPRLRPARSARQDALVSARLYALVDALTPAESAKQTFADCDVAAWLCFLRSQGYEYVAVVVSRLQREILSERNLVHAPNMEFARLNGADLSGSDLYRVNLSNADLRGARFVKADLSRSHLKGADLRGADLRGADLSYSSLELADLRGANLQGANLDRCFIDYATGL